MASFDRQFDILHPTIDRLDMQDLEVADTDLLDPTSITPVPLIDGELVQIDTNFKFIRGTTALFAQPSFFAVEWRGDYGVQASRKIAVVMSGGFWADTIVWASAPTLGDRLEMATISDARFGSVNRAGLQVFTSGAVIGYAVRLGANNGGKLRFVQTLV